MSPANSLPSGPTTQALHVLSSQDVRTIAQSVYRDETQKSLKWVLRSARYALGGASLVVVMSAFTAVVGTVWQLWGLGVTAQKAVEADAKNWVKEEVGEQIPATIAAEISKATIESARSAARANANVEKLQSDIAKVNVELVALKHDRERLLQELKSVKAQVDESKASLASANSELENARKLIKSVEFGVGKLNSDENRLRLEQLAYSLEQPGTDGLARLATIEEKFAGLFQGSDDKSMRMTVDVLNVREQLACEGSGAFTEVAVSGDIWSTGMLKIGEGNTYSLLTDEMFSFSHVDKSGKRVESIELTSNPAIAAAKAMRDMVEGLFQRNP